MSARGPSLGGNRRAFGSTTGQTSSFIALPGDHLGVVLLYLETTPRRAFHEPVGAREKSN